MFRLLAILLVPPLVGAAAFAAFRAIEKDRHYVALVREGDDLLARDLAVEASRSYGMAIALKPQEPLAYIKRADAEARQGNRLRAIEDVQSAGELSEDVLLVSSRLAELYYEGGDFEESARHYRKVLAVVPDSPEILYRLGLAHFRAGRAAEAIEELGKAAERREDFWEAYYLRGAVFLSIGGKTEAERDFRMALERASDRTLPREALIDFYIRENRPEEALPLVEEQIAARPEDARGYLRTAELNRLSGRTAEAIEAVGQALQRNPDLPDAYLRLGELWLSQLGGRDDSVAAEKAVAALSTAVKMDPASGEAALALGRAYLALGDEKRGFAELERAARATPVPGEALRLIGDLYRARGNPSEAVTAYHVYLKLNGDSPAVLEGLGDAYVESGDARRAAEMYRQLAELDPSRVSPVAKAARTYLQLGDGDSAARLCRLGLAANPENETLARILAQTRHLR
jgi:tetratricopeptide (TPR) repeat protein